MHPGFRCVNGLLWVQQQVCSAAAQGKQKAKVPDFLISKQILTSSEHSLCLRGKSFACPA